ncbi:MAG: ABC transporter permease [Chloroflexi bacterium]|nr:ABC transporter permease [Chloroflexota bacterium]MCC6896372.1 ABC transporter permease [Anaerolineae bacterium]
MNIVEIFRVAIGSLLINRLRAMLTTLGIIIGVGAVISLVSLGRGVENYISAQFQDLGSNILFVFSAVPASSTRTTIMPLTTIEGNALNSSSTAPSIQQVAMEHQIAATVIAEAKRTTVAVGGVTPNFVEVRNWQTRSGGVFISQSDVDNAARVAVLGTTIVERLYGDKNENPVGRTIRINDRVFTIIGVMEEKSAGLLGDQNTVLFIPISTAQTRLDEARTKDGGYQVDVFYVQAFSEKLMDQATREIEDYLITSHNVQFQGEQDFQIINQKDLLTSLGQITGILTAFLGLIASISLLVGGIGIMNIMLVSVTERTREIGLRKAVGAQRIDILFQFLIESLILSIIGGMMGVGLGWVATVLVSIFIPDLKVGVSLDSIALATAVSSIVGIVFGLYPAYRAAWMKPIDALRFE